MQEAQGSMSTSTHQNNLDPDSELNLQSEHNDGHDGNGSEDELSRIQALAAGIRDQDDLERNIGLQVCFDYVYLSSLLTCICRLNNFWPSKPTKGMKSDFRNF